MPQRGPLLHAEAVLLVDHRQRQVLELHAGLDQRVSADDDVDAAILQPGEDLFSFLPGDAAGEQANSWTALAPRHFSQETAQSLVVLLGQDLGGSHQRRLGARGYRQGHRRRRDDGLARSHVTLQQPVHRLARAQIGHDLL